MARKRVEPDIEASAAIARASAKLAEAHAELSALRARNGGEPPMVTTEWGMANTRRLQLREELEKLLGPKPAILDEALIELLGALDFSWAWYLVLLPVPPIVAAIDRRAKQGPIGDELAQAILGAASRLREFAEVPKTLKSDAAKSIKAAERLETFAGRTPGGE